MRSLVALLLLSSVASADSSVPISASPFAVMLSLERTACYGRCPIYKVSVLRDGTVSWEGERFVAVTGKATAKLSSAAFDELAQAWTHAGFFALETKYERRDVTDHPSAIVTIDDGKRHKTIRHYHGDRSAPRALGELEDAIDRILGTARWIGGDER